MAENDHKQRLMEELANAIIGLRMTARFAIIATARIDQECWERLSRSTWQIEYQTGSAYEGMPWAVCGDVDVMIASFNYPIVLCQSPTEGEQYRGGYVMAEDNKKEPAYLKLKVVDKDDLIGSLRDGVDKDGYLKCSILHETSNLLEDGTEVHGPSLANYISTKHPSRGNQDTVPCMKCKSWPSVTHEFFTRERKSDWPSQELLCKVLSLGCLVVAVAHPDSQSKDVEWRWSFSLSERELIQEISGPIAKCMYALKVLKKKYIINDSDRPTPFCSYFIKTACLWMCETFPHEESYSVMGMIRKVLDWLIECYQNINLPHYFIPKQNLIGHLPRKICDKVRRQLKELNSPDLWEFVMSTVGHGPFERHAINSMCKNLNISGVNEVEDYKTLEANLIYHPRAEEELEKAITELLPGGSLYDKYEHVGIVKWVRPDIASLLFVIWDFIKNRIYPSKILRLPEEIILPIVNRIEDVVPKGYEKMSVQRLYRYLGNVYNCLLMYLRKRDDYVSAYGLDLYKEKPIEYYNLGAEMVFPDMWSDQGIGGLALVIIYYYQNGNYYALKELFRDSEQYLRNTAESVDEMNRHISVLINSSTLLTQSAWEADKKLLLLAETSSVGFVYVHPIALVFYIQSKVSLQNGDKKKVSDIISCMEEWLKPNEERISEKELIATTKSLVGILKEEVNETFTNHSLQNDANER